MSRNHVVVLILLVLGVVGIGWWVFGGGSPFRPDAPDRPGEPGPESAVANGEDASHLPAISRRELEEMVSFMSEAPTPPTPEELLLISEAEGGVEALLAFLRSEGNLEKRVAVLIAIARNPDLKATDAVLEAAKGEFGEDLRVPGVLALTELGDLSIPLLSELARESPDTALAGSALQALAFQGTILAQQTLAMALRSAPGEKRELMIWVALAGGPVGGGPDEPEAVRRLRYQLLSPVHPHPEAGQAWREIFDRALAARGEEISMAAATAVLNVRGPEARDTFFKMWGSMSEPIREGVLAGLDPAWAAEKFVGLVELAPGMENLEDRRRISERLELSDDPVLLRHLEAWRATEADEGIRVRLDTAIKRLVD